MEREVVHIKLRKLGQLTRPRNLTHLPDPPRPCPKLYDQQVVTREKSLLESLKVSRELQGVQLS